MNLKPVGIIHTPFTKTEEMPIQPSGAVGTKGVVEIFDQFQDGLKDLDGFSHIILIYSFHRSQGYDLEVTPFLDTKSHGVFATRAPKRPNPIGLSIVRLEYIDNGNLYVQNIDVLNETPIFDIKPYVPDFDSPDNVRTGWFEHSHLTARTHKSDDRFS